ncbi:hypothetical protein [Metabacillus malikii]|uniref:Uncharacterized protein n=1 Tax=Metabacillus malikii TaxID=1504265 RepID=A0ABT9ZM40_9BACI|nr:hypothetical protein [Metabacillus malikii]MDQ0233349.1 hypothetical protein [Metabacillus malikii]
MKPNKPKSLKMIGWGLFFLAVALFCLQLGYLFVQKKYQLEYIDDRLFYIINILFIISLSLANLLILAMIKRKRLIIAGIALILMSVQVGQLISNTKEVQQIISISPDFKQILSIKRHIDEGEATYYRTHYGILARPKEQLPGEIVENPKIKWLADDIATITYKSKANTTQQFIATYGDRGDGVSYYNVGPETQGEWQGENITLVSNPEGITITDTHTTEQFTWENTKQYGTLAIVLLKDNEAAWTLALNKNFKANSNTPTTIKGNITLYKATLKANEPITLQQR